MSWNLESELQLKKIKFEPTSPAHVSDTIYIFFLLVTTMKVVRLLILGNNDVLLSYRTYSRRCDLNWQITFNWRKWD